MTSPGGPARAVHPPAVSPDRSGTIWACAHLGERDLVMNLLRLINPLWRSETAALAASSQVEPSVISADG
ncbi:MAG TPA: hypothetical protein VI542_02390 [Candidatus Tectomicrobia bacterium]